MTFCLYLQGIAGNDPIRLIDYSALYDSVVRATLWQEVRKLTNHISSLLSHDMLIKSHDVIYRTLPEYTGPAVRPMDSWWMTVTWGCSFNAGGVLEAQTTGTLTGKYLVRALELGCHLKPTD